MDPPRPFPDRARAEALADAGDWPGVYALLAAQDERVVAADRALAYRFGEALYHTGRLAGLAEFAAVYEPAARHAADTPGVMRALNLAGIAAFELGRTGAAGERFEALMELATASDDREMLARAANNLGALANLRGQPDVALSHYRLAIPVYQRLSRLRGLAQVHHNIGMSYRDLGWWREADSAYREAIRLATAAGYTHQVVMSTAGRAEVELRRGAAAVAWRLAEHALTRAREIGDPLSEAEALRVCGLARAREPGEEARDARETAMRAALDDVAAAERLALETGNRLLAAETARDTGTLLLAMGRTAEARRRLESAAAAFDGIGAEGEARRARASAEALE